MRLNNKYKNFNKYFLGSKILERLFNFKRPKWNKLKETLSKYKKKRKKFIVRDLKILKVNKKRFQYIKKTFKEKLNMKRKLSIFFDKKFVKAELKFKDKRSIFLNNIFKNFYRLTFFLWHINFFSSSYLVKQQIDSKKIELNGYIAKSDIFLRKNDFIVFKSRELQLKNLFKKSFSKVTIFSHVEIDFYSQSVYVVKNLNDLSDDDLQLIFNDIINVKVY